MKTVFTNDMALHTWAAQSQSNGRNSTHSIRFSGRELYSYSALVASFLDAPNGSRVVLFTPRTYSVTTSKIMNQARYAVRDRQCFTVPELKTYGLVEHSINMDYLIEHYRLRVAKLTRMRGHLYHTDAAHLEGSLNNDASDARIYAKLFNLPVPDIDCAADAKIIWDAFQKREARYADPQYGEKLRIAREKREAAQERKHERDIVVMRAKYSAAREAFRAGAPWLSGSLVRVDSEHGGAMLRVSADGKSLETSWGIRDFPLSTARIFLCAYFQDNTMTAWIGTPLGGFIVRSSSAERVQIGCHDFMRAELEQFAKLIGVKVS